MESLADFTGGGLFNSNSSKHCRKTVKYTKLMSSHDEGLYDESLEKVALMDDDSDDNYNTSDIESENVFTVEEAVESIGFGFFQIRLYIICGLFTAADALEMMLLAVLSPVLRCEWQLDHFRVAFLTTVVFIGMCIMAPVWGLMGDKYGRQTTLYMVTTWIGYFGLLTTFSPSFMWVLILRGLVGAGLAGSPQSFALLTEFLPSKSRAKMLQIGGITWAMGTLFEISIASLVIPTLGWRWLVAFSAMPSFLICVLIKLLPESARYLVAAGEKDRALHILQKAAKINKSSLPKGRLTVAHSASRGNVSDLLSPEYRRTSLQMWLMWFATAFSYYGMVLASAEILQIHNSGEESRNADSCKCNLLKSDDYITMLVSTFGEFLALPLNLLLIDRIGRRYTGAVNSCGMAIFFLLLQLQMPQSLLTIIMFMVRGFSQGLFNFVYIYTAEVYPTTIRTLGIGVASAWARVGAMLTPFVAQVLLDKSLTAAVWVYGLLGLLASLCAILLPIETKGRVLPQSIR
uniref:Transporter SVOPL isoform X1 n=1 Tax=Crassostrea virginica TaxID=6565 RepID=A0A8B8F0F7_CRAVI|nr:putative transporter SVOPL isoform X1 [Crassostrea virginica]XP_022345745.1 putative transporter SVOPL isoform X1 [Crassostrea virginica]